MANKQTRVSNSYTPLEQWMFLEIQALQRRVEVVETSMVYQEQYVNEIEERMANYDLVLERLLRDNPYVHDATEQVMIQTIQENSHTDDLQRLLDEYEEGLDDQLDWIEQLFE